MAIPTGTRTLGPDNATLVLRTTCEGAMARMGHDLTIVVEQWEATLDFGEAPAGSALAVKADLRSLRVTDAVGGAKPPADGDRDKIRHNAEQALDAARFPELTFVSSEVSGTWDDGVVVGRLTLAGRTEIQRFDVRREGAEYVLTGEVVQSRYGRKPYSAMMGALRVADAVTVEARAAL